jgi:hypothetical protein
LFRISGFEVLSDAGFRTSDFHLFHILARFDVPTGQVNEMLPTVVPVPDEIDLHKRTLFRALGLAIAQTCSQSGAVNRAGGNPWKI